MTSLAYHFTLFVLSISILFVFCLIGLVMLLFAGGFFG